MPRAVRLSLVKKDLWGLVIHDPRRRASYEVLLDRQGLYDLRSELAVVLRPLPGPDGLPFEVVE